MWLSPAYVLSLFISASCLPSLIVAWVMAIKLTSSDTCHSIWKVSDASRISQPQRNIRHIPQFLLWALCFSNRSWGLLCFFFYPDNMMVNLMRSTNFWIWIIVIVSSVTEKKIRLILHIASLSASSRAHKRSCDIFTHASAKRYTKSCHTLTPCLHATWEATVDITAKNMV